MRLQIRLMVPTVTADAGSIKVLLLGLPEAATNAELPDNGFGVQ